MLFSGTGLRVNKVKENLFEELNMKVYTTFGDGIDGLKLTESPEPKVKSNEVLVKMTAVSLNYRDLLVIKGVESWKPAEPRVPISDGVGEIVALGEEVSRFRLGDRVAGVFLPKWLDGELTPEKYVLPLGGAADGVLAEYRSLFQAATKNLKKPEEWVRKPL